MEAAGEWAQAVSLPRPPLLEALRDDSCVRAALADGDGGSRSSRSSVANPVRGHASQATDEVAAAHVCGVDVQLTRPRSEPPIVQQAIEITGSAEPAICHRCQEGTGAGQASGSLISYQKIALRPRAITL